MNSHRNLISFAALAFSLFFAGSFLIGTCTQTRFLRQNLKEIEKEYQSINYRMDSIYQKNREEEAEILKSIDLTYKHLDTLRQAKARRTQRINRTRRNQAKKPDGVSGMGLQP